MLVLGGEAVIDELAPGAVLVELGGAFAQGGRFPEGGAQLAALPHDFRLLDPFREQDVERAERHDAENADRRIGDETALFERFDKAELVLRRCIGRRGKEIDDMHA